MKVNTYIHGSSEQSDEALWIALGPYLCSREVGKELGSPIYSIPGTRWFVAYNDENRVIGFASMRITPSAVWYDYAYVESTERSKGVFTAMSTLRDFEAGLQSLPTRAVIREKRWNRYKERGWEISSKRGSWINIIREIP